MAKVVFILGAGASADSGAPLMANFLDTAKDFYDSGQFAKIAPQFETVSKAIRALQAVHSKSRYDLTNIESVFTALDTAQLLKKLPQFSPDEIPGALDALKEVIVHTLEHSVQFAVRNRVIVSPGSYGPFVDLIQHIRDVAHPQKSVAVITFNYDIALDVSLAISGVDATYGLDTEEDRANRSLPLLKLHGSLNWGQLTKDSSIVALPMPDFFRIARGPIWSDTKTATVPIGSTLRTAFANSKQLDVQPGPIIVPPTWRKADHHSTLTSVWQRAAAELSDAEQVFVIGYSMPDSDGFFRTLYALGTAGDVPFQRFAVCDLNGTLEEKFRGLLGPGAERRYEFFRTSFGAFIPTIKGFFPGRR